MIVAPILAIGILIFLSLLGIVPILGVLIHLVVQPVLTGPLFAGTTRVFLGILRKETVDFSMIFWGFGRRFLQLALVTAIPQFALFLVLLPAGMFMGFVIGTTSGFPGTTPAQPPAGMLAGIVAFGVLAFVLIVWISVRWMYALYLVVDKNYAAVDALRLSYKMVGKHWWVNFLVLLVSGIIAVLGFLGCIIGVFVTIPFASCAYAASYKQIFDRLEPKSDGH